MYESRFALLAVVIWTVVVSSGGLNLTQDSESGFGMVWYGLIGFYCLGLIRQVCWCLSL